MRNIVCKNGDFSVELLDGWTLSNEEGEFKEICDRISKEAVVFALNDISKPSNDPGWGVDAWMPLHGDGRSDPVDAINISLGLSGGSVKEPYFQIAISSVVAEMLDQSGIENKSRIEGMKSALAGVQSMIDDWLISCD